jgi:hypothetical protein
MRLDDAFEGFKGGFVRIARRLQLAGKHVLYGIAWLPLTGVSALTRVRIPGKCRSWGGAQEGK